MQPKIIDKIFRNDLAATTVDGFTVANKTIATLAIPVQVSPATNYESHAWDTDGFSDGHYCRVALVPVSAAVTTSALSWYFRKDPNEVAGAYDAAMMSLSNTGVVTVGETGCYVSPKTALGASLAAPATVNPTVNDGILLTNNASGATAVQEWSPSLRFDAVGYTAAATYTRQSWAIVNKPTSATAGKFAFEFASAGGAYIDVASITSSATRNDILIHNPANSANTLNMFVLNANGTYIAGNYGELKISNSGGYLTLADSLGNFLVSSTMLTLTSNAAASASVVGTAFGTKNAYTAEGARLLSYRNVAVDKSSIDKDGVYWQGYGSAGTLTSAAPVVKTLVTLCDVNSTYIIEWYAIIEDQVGDAAHNGAYYCQAVYDKVAAGSLVRRWGTAVPELYDTAGDFTCVDSTADGNSIIVTASTTLAAHTFNVKIYGVRVMKCGNTSLAAGVAYPMAA